MLTSGIEWRAAHSVIGILMFAAVWLIAGGGILQHLKFRKYRKRTVFGVMHAWSGRTAITLALINGGLGLALAGGHGPGAYAAYGIISGIIWLLWAGSTIVSLKRDKHRF